MRVTVDIQKIIGLEGGGKDCFFKILSEQGRGETEYYPSFKNGKELHWDHPDYWKHKITKKRETIRVTVAGNPIAAEDEVKKILGCKCLACSPNTLDIYPQEVA